MSEYHPWFRPFARGADFLSHRGWPFWSAVIAGAFVAAVFLSLFPGDRQAETAARRLANVEPTVATEVLWHVVDGYLEDVAVVVPGAEQTPFTVDLVGVDGSDEVSAYDGWQPAPMGAGAEDYLPPLRVRVDLSPPAVAMRDVTVAEYAGGSSAVIDLVLASSGALVVVAALVLSVRQDRQLAPPRRWAARRHAR